VKGALDYLVLMVSNPIDKAIRFTPVGGVIDIHSCKMNSSGSLNIEDNGRGIPVADRSQESF
jgi:signal transduction histidine kinase